MVIQALWKQLLLFGQLNVKILCENKASYGEDKRVGGYSRKETLRKSLDSLHLKQILVNVSCIRK